MIKLMWAILEIFWTVVVFIFSLGFMIIASPFLALIVIPVAVVGLIGFMFLISLGVALMIAIVQAVIYFFVPGVVLYIVLKLLKIV